MTVDLEALEKVGRDLLVALGEDPDRDGLVDTPGRYARWWQEFIDYDPGRVATSFEVEGVDEMVVVSGMETWSLCEHHLLPMRLTITAGYIPAGRILGLSKFARMAHAAAHRLQVQERLTEDLATAIGKATGSPDVAVVVAGEHLCMAIRGVKTRGTMRTSVLWGVFREDPRARGEFLALARGA